MTNFLVVLTERDAMWAKKEHPECRDHITLPTSSPHTEQRIRGRRIGEVMLYDRASEGQHFARIMHLIDALRARQSAKEVEAQHKKWAVE